MNSAAGWSRLRPEYDAFLFAPVGEERSGMSLSVVSALARMDLDPWQEAACLAALPPESATQRIAAMLEALPSLLLKPPDVLIRAKGLAAMLPRPVSSVTSPAAALSAATPAAVTRPPANAVFLVLYIIFMLATQLLVTHLLPPPPDSTQQSPSSTALQLPSAAAANDPQ
jgi:hypothetical protein